MEQSYEYKIAILAEKDINENVTKALKSDKAHRRWFWELLQNAKDTVINESDRRVSIKLAFTKSGDGERILVFQHSGNPFKFAPDPTIRFDDLTNLILPSSGKPPGRATGKFGTGFLSTHILSLKIGIEGIYQDENNQLSSFKTQINRTETGQTEESKKRRIEEIVKSLSEKSSSFTPVKNDDYSPSNKEFRTAKFIYYLASNKNGEEHGIEIVKEGIKDLHNVLSYVLNFVPEIDTVEITDTEFENVITAYSKVSEEKIGDVRVSTISKTIYDLQGNKISGKNISIASLNDEKVEIAVEVLRDNGVFRICDFKTQYRNETNKEFPILFSSFPLIGSDDLNFPIVINSIHFNPNETRNGVELKTNSDGNQALIQNAVILYLKLMDIASIDWKDVFVLARTDNSIPNNHDWIDKKWFEEGNNDFPGILKPIRDKILNTAIIDILTVDGKIERKAIRNGEKLNQIFFPPKENKEKLHEFGSVIFPNSFPILADVDNWDSIIWNELDFTRAKIEFIIEGIAKSENVGNLAHNLYGDKLKTEEALAWLYNFYDIIKTDFKENTIALFNHFVKNVPIKFIPNRDLIFSSLSDLKKDVGYKGTGIIDETLLTIHSELTNENLKSKLLHAKFSDYLFTKETLTEEQVASIIRDLVDDKLKKTDSLSVSLKNTLSKLYDWISIRANDKKDYFREAIKNRILSAIMPSEKVQFVTTILELDRNNTISLERQVAILNEPHLEKIIELGKVALEEEYEKQADFAFKNKIGLHIEELIRKKIRKEITNIKVQPIDVEDKQGGQDMVVKINNEIVYYIEVKSRWVNKDSIRMSYTQIKQAQKQKKCYSLCCVNMFDYYPSNSSRYEVPDVSLIYERIRFITDIGLKLETIIGQSDSIEDDEIKLFPDFKATVPQKYIDKHGREFEPFVEFLLKELKLQ